MARDYRVLSTRGSYVDQLSHAPLGTSRRRYYDEIMQYDPSALCYQPEDCLEEALRKPKHLVWEEWTVAVTDKRVMPLHVLDMSEQPGAFAYPIGSGTIYSVLSQDFMNKMMFPDINLFSCKLLQHYKSHESI